MWREIKNFILTWKPIHLCWWFQQRGIPVPKFLIGGASSPPSVTTNAASSVKKDRATLNGDVTSDGGQTITARGFVYSITSVNSSPTIGGAGVTDTGNLGGTTGTYSNTPTGLIGSTQYSFKAYATNSKGTSYGSALTFTTNAYTSVSLSSPADAATEISVTPNLTFTGTDSDSLDVRYNVQVSTIASIDGLIDSYSESNYDSDGTLSSDSGSSGKGQSFAGVAGKIISAKFYLYKVGTPTGNAVAKLYAISGTHGSTAVPSGSALATSDNLDVSTLGTSMALATFNFTGANQYTMSAGTNYIIAIEYSGSGGTNNIRVGLDVSSPSHAGNYCSATNAMVWSASSTIDTIFYVYIESGVVYDRISGTDSGFSGTPDNTDPFASGQAVTYTIHGGTGAGTNSYYFDGSDAAASDPDTVWTNDANAFDSDSTPSTYAYTSTVGSAASNYLKAEGTDAPSSYLSEITQVRARIAGGSNLDSMAWGSYTTLTKPTGGWTWSIVSSLETKIYAFTSAGTYVAAAIYTDSLGTLLGTPSCDLNASTTEYRVYKIEIEVTASDRSLSNNTTYYWRVRGKDPSGSNTYGSWATTRSFTTVSSGTGGIGGYGMSMMGCGPL